VRTFTPAVAGAGRMPRGRFTAYNVAGGLAWAVGLLVAGYFLGGVPVIAAHIELFGVGMVAASLVPGAVMFVRGRVRGRLMLRSC
jgi:membrane-associated protein